MLERPKIAHSTLHPAAASLYGEAIELLERVAHVDEPAATELVGHMQRVTSDLAAVERLLND